MKNIILDTKTNSANETINVAEDFIKSLDNKNVLLILSGELGSGKTHFTKGIFKGLNFHNYQEVTSPTFDLVNTFQLENLTVHHFDLYRLEKLNEEDVIWLNEIISEKSLCIIEWGDRFEFNLNKKTYLIKIEFLTENERQIKIFTN